MKFKGKKLKGGKISCRNYSELGNGFLEAVYQEAFEIELKERTVPFEPQKLSTINLEH